MSSPFPLLCLGNYSPIHLPVLCLDQPITELPLLCAIFPLVSCFLCSTLLLVLGCALLSNYKSCALVLCTPEPTRPQWREQLSVAGEYDPKIDPKRRPANSKDPGKECGYLEDPMEQDKVACKLCNKIRWHVSYATRGLQDELKGLRNI